MRLSTVYLHLPNFLKRRGTRVIGQPMLTVGRYRFFCRGTGPDGAARHFMIAASHPKWSITWLWSLWWFPPRSWNRPLGVFRFAKQDAMPRLLDTAQEQKG